ncbi:MAG: hypothetical protein SGJ13_12705, partial [Actinomycetota bacterium]|nr:hypothetical protein [Actinomycetota bacterium]
MNWHAFSAAHRRGLLVGGAVAISTVAFGAGAFAVNGAADDGNSEVTVENASSAQNVTTTVEETTTTVPETTTTAAPTTTLPPPTTTT